MRKTAPAAAVVLLTLATLASAQTPSPQVLVWDSEQSQSLDAFDKAAARAQSLGATHMVITDNLPRAFWLYDGPPSPTRDPYPAWYDYRPGLFRVFTPEPLQKYIPQEYSQSLLKILQQRCEVLRNHHLQGLWIANEPQILPEAVFRDHPEWRGPRVDQPNRSRTPHFAPCVDEPAVLALYTQSMKMIAEKCPEITLFRFTTTDAGAGLCWTSGLYPGINGPAHCKDVPLDVRVKGFLDALLAGNPGAHIRLLQIHPEEWMLPTFPDPRGLALQMPPHTAIDNFEAQTAAPEMSQAGNNSTWNFFYPVRGIPQPIELVSELRRAQNAQRVEVSIPLGCDELYATIYTALRKNPPRTTAAEYALLEQIADNEVGPENAETLISLWTALDKTIQFGSLVNWVYPSLLGGVHQRWITRPFLPFPETLPADQAAYYRNFLFQAKGEEQANDLVDTQAMRLYKGWPGRMFITNVYNKIDPQLKAARASLARLKENLPPEKRAPYEALDLKLHAAQLLATNARNAVNYQAVLDYLKARNVPPDADPPLGTLESWDRRMILEIARDEIDNTAALRELLLAHPDLLDHAATRAEEDITLLGPDLAAQLQTKIDLMNDHWKDYDKLTTVPNP
jgi:hypothetical protein